MDTMSQNGVRGGMLAALRDQSYENGQIQFTIGSTEFAAVIESVLLRETGPLTVFLVSLAKKVDDVWTYLKLEKVEDRQLSWEVELIHTCEVFDRIISFIGGADITLKFVPAGHPAIALLPERNPQTE